MKSMQRKFGGLMKRSEDQQDVGAVLAQFKAVDEMLDSLIRDLKSYRNTWEDILKYQYDCSEAFAGLYKPIEPPPPPEHSRQPTETPQKYMQKCLGLQKLYSQAKTELAQEITMIDNKLIRPAVEAKGSIKALHKTRKHRENTKLDYERYLSRAEHARKKDARSVKEEAALAAHEQNLAQAKIDYETADDQVKVHFPPVTEAVISLMPQLLASQVMLHTTIVGHLYTVLDTYCKRSGLPSPAPNDAEIVRVWDSEFTGFRKELEQGISTIANGKAVHMGMTVAEKKEGTLTGLGIRNRVMTRVGSAQNAIPQRPTIGSRLSSGAMTPTTAGHAMDDTGEIAPPKPPRPGQASPSIGGGGMRSPSINMSSKPRISSASGLGALTNNNSYAPYDHNPTASMPHQSPPPPSYEQAATASGDTTPPSRYQTPVNGVATPFTSSSPDYFTVPANNRRTSQTSNTLPSSLAVGAGAGAKKKPPPPVPAKRIPSQPLAQYVTALFDFEGQGEGDLAFREGDRIKVVRKTESTDDWWEGELRGAVGSFPANYVQV